MQWCLATRKIDQGKKGQLSDLKNSGGIGKYYTELNNFHNRNPELNTPILSVGIQGIIEVHPQGIEDIKWCQVAVWLKNVFQMSSSNGATADTVT